MTSSIDKNRVTFEIYKPAKMEVVESLMDEALVKLEEDSSDFFNEPTTAQARKRQSMTIQTLREQQTPIHKIKLELPVERSPAKLTPLKNKSLPLATELKRIKIAPPVNRAPEKKELEKHRYNIRTILLCSNATPIRGHYIGSGYICSFCDMHFLDAADLKMHTIHDHDDKAKKKFMNRTCLFKFAVNLDITTLTCSICDMVTDTLEQLIDHLNILHQKGIHTDVKNQIVCFKLDQGVKCYICCLEYNSFKLLREHMNKHLTNYICDECGAGFVSQCHLRTHSESHKVGAHKCDTCGKMLKSNARLMGHIRQRHSGILLYKCSQCNKRFKSTLYKKKHIEEAHGIIFADFQCDACDRTFKNNDGLRIHIKRDHLMERRFKCEICDYNFYTKGLLNRHKVTHTGSRDFSCELCSKSYSRKCSLTEHMRVHNNDRRFKCTFCDMTFLQKNSMKGHLRNRHNAELQ